MNLQANNLLMIKETQSTCNNIIYNCKSLLGVCFMNECKMWANGKLVARKDSVKYD